jgi:hypothetical protein
VALSTVICLWSCTAGAQTLSVDGTRFGIDGRATRLLLFISYFDGLHASKLNDDLDYLSVTLRFDGIRVLPNWQRRDAGYCPIESDETTLFDAAGNVRGDTTPASGPLKRLLDLIDAARARTLVVDVSFTRETVPGLNEENYVRAATRTAKLLAPYRNVLIDLQNEIDKNALSEAQTTRLREAIAAVDAARVIVASRGGPAPDVIAYNQRIGATAIAYHDPRVAQWAEQTAAAVAPLAASGRPVYLQEPQAWNSGMTICHRVEGKTLDADGDAAHFRGAVTHARDAGAAAWTFHTRQGFRLDTADGIRSRVQANSSERALLEGAAGAAALSTIASGSATTR